MASLAPDENIELSLRRIEESLAVKRMPTHEEPEPMPLRMARVWAAKAESGELTGMKLAMARQRAAFLARRGAEALERRKIAALARAQKEEVKKTAKEQAHRMAYETQSAQWAARESVKNALAEAADDMLFGIRQAAWSPLGFRMLVGFVFLFINMAIVGLFALAAWICEML